METKNKAQQKVEKKRGLFLNLGILVALTVVMSAFEWKTPVRFAVIIPESLQETLEFIPVTDIPEPEPPKPKVFLINPVEMEIEDPEPEEIEIIIDNEKFVEFVEPVIEVPVETTEEIVVFAEKMPEPMGGLSAFYKYVGDALKYPARARKMGIQGKVFVQFVIDKQGNFTEVQAIKGIGGGCDEEAVRVLKSAPAWHPGKQRGVPVQVRMVLPITFSLQ